MIILDEHGQEWPGQPEPHKQTLLPTAWWIGVLLVFTFIASLIII